MSIQSIAKAGDNIVSSTDLYRGTWNLFNNTLKDRGIEVRFVGPSDPANFKRAIDKNSCLLCRDTAKPEVKCFSNSGGGYDW